MNIMKANFLVLASNAAGADDDVIVPERVDISAVRLPTKIDCCDLRYNSASRPSCSIAIGDTRLESQASNSIIIQPSLNGAISAQMVFEALPGASRESGRGGNALRGEIRKGGIVRLAVVH